MTFQPYPFEKLNTLLDSVSPDTGHPLINLTIGEPQFETPDFIQQALCDHSALLKKYPRTSGETVLKESQQSFVKNRFGIALSGEQIIPTLGTREVLFNFPQFLLFGRENPTMAYTSPFYQIYEGAAIASRADSFHLTLNAQNGYVANPEDPRLQDCDLVILNYPNNPTGASADMDLLRRWVKTSLTYGFVLINDECYSEIYAEQKPVSLLEASIEAGNETFENILVVNSLSKRSSAPGIRSGFIAGDAAVLQRYMRYRTYVGCASPLPLQYAAAAAWQDFAHAEKIRHVYAQNLKVAREVLGIDVPQATFYLWLQVGDDETFARELFRKYHIKTLPGRYLGRESAGEGYVRIALVYDEKTTRDACEKIHAFLKEEC